LTILVTSTNPFSLRRVAEDIYVVLKSLDIDTILASNIFQIPFGVEAAIVVCNPDFECKRIVEYLRDVRKIDNIILYLTVEGRLKIKFDLFNEYVIIANSSYTMSKLREAGYKVKDIIPHGVRYLGRYKYHKINRFGYIAGYQERKYPEFIMKHICSNKTFYRKRLHVITNRYNPYIGCFNVYAYSNYSNPISDNIVNSLYEYVGFYLNLSGAEGFGITLIEAIAHGLIVITPSIEPFTKILNLNTTLWVRPTGKKYYVSFGGWEDIEIHEYDINDFEENIKYAMDMEKEEYIDWSIKNYEFAEKYYMFDVYAEFLRYL